MHIGFLTGEYVTKASPDGGLANYIRKTGLALARRGHKVSVFVLSDRHSCWQDELITVYNVKRSLLTSAIYLAPFPKTLRPFFNLVLSSRSLTRTVWKIHGKYPFDILQVPSFAVPGLALIHNNRVPIICRASSYTPLVRSAYGRQRSFGEYLIDWLEARQIIDAEASFAPSNFLSLAFERIEGYPLKVIRTPIDDLLNMPMDESYYLSHLSGKQYLLFFGTLSRIKGADLLAEVIPDVSERYPQLQFVFIGRDDGLPTGQRVFNHIQSKCEKCISKLHYHSALPKPQLNAIIANSIGVLMPSRVDNYPNACLEAQSFGIPAIGTYGSSLDEMINDGVTGFLAENGSSSSLKDAIMRLMNLTQSQRQKMKSDILDTINSIQTEDRIGQLLAFYESVIDDFNRR